jgi:thioredoxin 1
MTPTIFDNLIKQQNLSLVDFYAHWCGACGAMEPTLQRLLLAFGNNINIVRIDTDTAEHRKIVRRYNIVSVPTFILFGHGEALWRDSGIVGYDILAAAIRRYTRQTIYNR